jgi:hypothetical protein
VSRQEPEAAPDRSWNVRLLTETEPGRRNRRTLDSGLLVAASLVVGLSAVITSSAPGHDEDVAQALATVLGWAGAAWRTIFVCLLALALVIVIDVLLRRRWDLVRDLLIDAVLLVGSTVLLGGAVGSDWFPIEPHLLSQWGYPDLRLAAATSVFVVVGPELVRPLRLLAVWLVPLAALGAIADVTSTATAKASGNCSALRRQLSSDLAATTIRAPASARTSHI